MGAALVVEPWVGVNLNLARYAQAGLEAGWRIYRGPEIDEVDEDDLSGFLLSMNLRFGKF